MAVNLSPAEEWAMKEAFRKTMLRCADIIARITDDDVLEAQAVLLADGVSFDRVAKIDRAMLADKHIRACVIVSDERRKSEGEENA